MADSESAALTGLGDTPALGAVGETRTLMALTTATSRLRVYQFRHDRLHSKKTIVFPESFLHSREKNTGTGCKAANINAEPGWIASHPSQQALRSRLQREPASSVQSSPYRARRLDAADSAC